MQTQCCSDFGLQFLADVRIFFQELLGVDTERQEVVYSACPDPTQAQLFRIALEDGAEPTALTKEPGTP